MSRARAGPGLFVPSGWRKEAAGIRLMNFDLSQTDSSRQANRASLNSDFAQRPARNGRGGTLARLTLAAVALTLPGPFTARLLAGESLSSTVHLQSPQVERFMGLGIQWDPYEYPPTPEGWKKTVDRVDFMRPGFFRVMLNASSYARFDANGNPSYAWNEGEAGMNRLTWLFNILDYAQSHKIDVLVGEWSPSRGMAIGNGQRAGAADPHWAQVHAEFASYLLNTKKYSVIKYFNYMNEPNGDWMWPGGKVDYDSWATGIRNLRKALDAKGLTTLRVAGPDNSGNWEWLDRCANELRNEFGAWEMHWYAKDADVLEGKMEALLTEKRAMLLKTDPNAASKPLFLGESGMIEGKVNGDQQPRTKTFPYGVLMMDYLAQVARAGWQGGTAWDMDDAMHTNSGRANPPTERTLKIWGFWNTQGTAMGHPEDENVRPWFYSWSVMSRLFPAGAKIVKTEDSPQTSGIRTLAAALPGGVVSFMVVNESDAARTVTVKVPGVARKAVEIYRYFDQDRPANELGYPVPSQKLANANLAAGVTLELPGRGVAFLTTAAGPVAAQPRTPAKR
jgi:hypothetical protein